MCFSLPEIFECTVCDHWLEMSPQEPLTVKGMLGVLNACCVTLKVAATSTHTYKVVSILNNKITFKIVIQ